MHPGSKELMRLSKEMIKLIADEVVINLETKEMVKAPGSRGNVSARIAGVITEDMQAEDKLNKDVEKLLAAHEDEIARGQMDYRKVFELTKQKLAKERGLVL